MEICRETMGLTYCAIDQAVFYQHDSNSNLIMATHVDDCTITLYPVKLVAELKQKLGTCVEVTDLGD